MTIQRTIPPVAAPIEMLQLLHGLAGFIFANHYLNQLKATLIQYFNAKQVFLLCSGKAALTTALRALNSLSPERDEVIVPAYTCYSVPSAILKAGLKVILCDIDPSTMDFDYNSLAKKISSNTLCIIPTHLFGIPADVDRIRELIGKRDIFILEDAAQAMGGSFNGRKLGTIGDIGIFSFGRGKNMTCGSGGLIVTNSDAIAAALGKEFAKITNPPKLKGVIEYIKLMALSLFIHPCMYWFPSGLSFLKLGETFFHRDFPVTRLSGMHAAMLTGWSKRLEQANQTRRQNAADLIKHLRLKPRTGLAVNFLRLPLTAQTGQARGEIISISVKGGFGIGSMYPAPLNEIEALRSSFAGQSYPAAKWLSERLFTVPTHNLLRGKDKKNIASVLSAFDLGLLEPFPMTRRADS
jgi:dTDP-4-amino-4,6-dideoxygalactose transaminase